MSRNTIQSLLRKYRDRSPQSSAMVQKFLDFVEQYPDCFERSQTYGHITGSAWLLDPTGQRVLLTHHKKLNQWLQLGGHADGDPDPLAVALKEAREESGIAAITPLSREIWDLDVHVIPARPSRPGRPEEPAHFHFDVRFLLQATESAEFTLSDESNELRWFSPTEARSLKVDESVQRMVDQWEQWLVTQTSIQHSNQFASTLHARE